MSTINIGYGSSCDPPGDHETTGARLLHTAAHQFNCDVHLVKCPVCGSERAVYDDRYVEECVRCDSPGYFLDEAGYCSLSWNSELCENCMRFSECRLAMTGKGK